MAEEKDFRHLVRVVNSDLDGNKPIMHALLKIKGVGFMYAGMMCHATGINPTKKAGYLSDGEIEKLNDAMKTPGKYGVPSWIMNRRRDFETGNDNHLLLGDLDLVQGTDIKRMKKIKSYKGMRHASGLPVRGQSTRSNFRRNKGNVMGVKKKKAGAPPPGK